MSAAVSRLPLHPLQPATAQRLLAGADYRRLIDAIPNIAGTKNTRPDILVVSDLATNSPELQHFYGELGSPSDVSTGSVPC